MEKFRFHNPFPSQTDRLHFVRGRLFCSVQSQQKFPIGSGFFLLWETDHLSVFHRSQPLRSLWAMHPGTAFVSAARGEQRVEESRGSAAIHDKLDIVCGHQTIEHIKVVWTQSKNANGQVATATNECNYLKQGSSRDCFVDVMPAKEDGDGRMINIRGPMVIIEGCLYSEPQTAEIQLQIYSKTCTTERGPFYPIVHAPSETGCFKLSYGSCVGIRYSLILSEQRDNHLGFSLQLDQPIEQVIPNCRDCYHNMCETSSRSLEEHGGLQPFPGYDYMSKVVRRSPEQWCIPKLKLHSNLMDRGFLLINKALSVIRKVHSAHIVTAPKRADLSAISKQSEDVRSLPRFNRVLLTYQTEENEKIYGFGEQFSYFDMKGRWIPVLVQEQGIGRGDQPITAAANLVAGRSGGNWHTTYAPVPHYITSELRSLFLEGYSYSTFDFRTSGRVQIQVHADEMQGRILNGTSPLDLIQLYTEATGRMRELPAWILKGAVVGMQGGTDTVRRVWEQLQNLGVPVSAFWLQDWVGQRKTTTGWQLWWNWELDTEHYPGWCQLTEDFQSKGVRIMAYFNPFLVPTDKKMNKRRDLFAEAKSQNFLIQNKKGSPYMIPVTSFEAALVDLTNPHAFSWLKGIMRDLAVQARLGGWMADFGECLPFDSVLFSGQDPAFLRNRYPELWAKLNRELIEELEAQKQELRRNISKSHTSIPENEQGAEDGEDQDSLVFFMRAGYRDSPRWTTLFWEGDQMVSWQRHDGIKSAVVGLLSSGLSGYAFNHSDIGGFCTVDLPFLRYRRSEELLLRWMELNAFTTIYRTHEGNIPSANYQFYSSTKCLSHFARFAKIYKAWEFYRIQLVKEAAATGLPVVRHLFLHYPYDKHVQTLTYQQFLVGSEFMVVPALDKGCKQVEAYFPDQEQWQHIWTGRTYGREAAAPPSHNGAGFTHSIDCPLGYPAVFVKKGSSVGHTFVKNLMEEGLSSFQQDVSSLNHKI